MAAELDRGFFKDGNLNGPLPNWLTWLRKPFELANLLSDGQELLLPLDDLRVRPFVAEITGVFEDDDQAPPQTL